MKHDKQGQIDLRAPVRRTLKKLEIEDAERKTRLRDRLKRLFKRRPERP
jgi:hypothetical protein